MALKYAFALLFGFGLSLGACAPEGGAENDAAPATEAPASAEEPRVLTRTIVDRHDDGTETVTTVQVTAAQQAEDKQRIEATREAIAAGLEVDQTLSVTHDPTCASATFVGYDGIGDDICFYGIGSANLALYVRNSGLITAGGPPYVPFTNLWYGRDCTPSGCGSIINAIDSFSTGATSGYFDTADGPYCSGKNTSFTANNLYGPVSPSGAYLELGGTLCE